jgi:hypothetical protein
MSERRARYIVSKAPHVGGPPIPGDEPALVVRGHDHLCLPTIDFYIDQYTKHLRKLDPGTAALAAHEVLDELILHRRDILAFQARPGQLIKWADR